MPFVQVALRKGRTDAQKRIIANAIYEAMRASINIPENDRFILLNEHDDSTFHVDPTFMDIQRSADVLLIHITLRQGRSTEMKQALYQQIAERLQDAAKIRSQDIFIVLHENTSPDWSFGNGVAQFTI
jgi:4-oxalocrotonate tautomerase